MFRKYYLFLSRQLRYPFSLLIITAVFVVSLIKMPQMEQIDVPLADKWTHMLMYFCVSIFLWIEYFYRHVRINYRHLCLLTIVFPIFMGGLIELLQAYCTDTRSGDWFDFLANSCGVVLATLLCFALRRPLMRFLGHQ